MTSQTRTSPVPYEAAHPLEDPDILTLVLQQTGISFDYDTRNPDQDRANLRLLHSTASGIIDGMCTTYKDGRRSGEAMLTIDPTDVASRAVAALRKLRLRRLALEGLDDDALTRVLAAAAEVSSSISSGVSTVGGSPLEVLCLQRGVFTGTSLHTCDPKKAAYANGQLGDDDDDVKDNDSVSDKSDVASLQSRCDAPKVDVGGPTSSTMSSASSPTTVFVSPQAVSADETRLLPPSLPHSPSKGRLLPRVIELDLGGCGQMTDAGLEALCTAAPLLAQLRITVNARLRKPHLTCPWLRVATLAICANLRDEAVTALCSGSPLLRELNLWRCTSLVSPPFRLPYLETLNMCECADLTDGALNSVSACSRLSSLLLAGCDRLAGTHRWGGGRALTSLDVSDMAATNDAQISAACTDSPRLRRIDLSRSGPGVRSPSIGGDRLQTIIATRCEHLVDDAVSLACDRTPQLQTLMLALCTSLHSPRIHGEHLSELNMSGCCALRDHAVTFVCENAPALQRLSLSLCAALVEPRVIGPRLLRVELSHCEMLARPAIGGAALHQVSLSGCTRLEDEPLEALCVQAPALRKLSVSGCTGLKTARIRALCLHHLNCQGVTRSIIDNAADRLQCPCLQRIVGESYADADGFQVVD